MVNNNKAESFNKNRKIQCDKSLPDSEEKSSETTTEIEGLQKKGKSKSDKIRIDEEIVSGKIAPSKENIVLNYVTYKLDNIISRKLSRHMNNCAGRMETKIWVCLTEIQKVNKSIAMSFINDINKYLKVFRTWKKRNNAENFQALEIEIWCINRRISTWMSLLYECDYDAGSDDEFYYE